MQIKFHPTYPESYGPNAGKPTTGEATCNGVTTLQILAECGGVFRMVQGITGKTVKEREASMKAIAESVFADVLSGNAPEVKVPSTHDHREEVHPDLAGLKSEIDATSTD